MSYQVRGACRIRLIPTVDPGFEEGGISKVPGEIGCHRRFDERSVSLCLNRPTKVSSAVLVGLYEEPERPPNAVDYIKRYMGAPTGVDVEALRQENESVRPFPVAFVILS